MKLQVNDFAPRFLAETRHWLLKHDLPRIECCLKMLDEEDIRRRPHRPRVAVPSGVPREDAFHNESTHSEASRIGHGSRLRSI